MVRFMKIFLVSLLLACVFAVQADIYRWVDAQGNVHFSDEPVKNAEKLELPPLPTYKAPPLPKFEYKKPDPPAQEKNAVVYTKFSIAKPSEDSVVWNDERNVIIQFEIVPPLDLKNGHRIVVLLDGVKQPGLYSAAQVVLANVDRGTHSVSGVIQDEQGVAQKSSNSVQFHLRQHSVSQTRGNAEQPSIQPNPLPTTPFVQPDSNNPQTFRRTLVQPQRQ